MAQAEYLSTPGSSVSAETPLRGNAVPKISHPHPGSFSHGVLWASFPFSYNHLVVA